MDIFTTNNLKAKFDEGIRDRLLSLDPIITGKDVCYFRNIAKVKEIYDPLQENYIKGRCTIEEAYEALLEGRYANGLPLKETLVKYANSRIERASKPKSGKGRKGKRTKRRGTGRRTRRRR